MRAADAPAELIQLREPKPVRAVHEHRIGVGNVDPTLHDERGHEHVDLAGHELAHDLLQVAVLHLAMPDANPRPRRDTLHVIGNGENRLDAIMHEEDLAATIQLARDAFVDEAVIPRLEEGEHRRAVARRRLHQREITQPRE